MDRILVIKLGALGDFILSYRAMTAIRTHHARARITLLTIPSLAPLAEACGLFDEIWFDSRPGFFQPGGWLALARRLNGGDFARVYDLQTSGRSGRYFRLLGFPFAMGRPQWSGIVKGCSHRHDALGRTNMHTLERQADQLAIAGIGPDQYPALDLGWANTDISRHAFVGGEDPYVLLVAGGSARHPEKRWPAERYGELALALAGQGFIPVVVGTQEEAEACAAVAAASATAVNLCGDSPLLKVMALARGAHAAVGNDTGPMHLIALMGCACVSLFSAASMASMNRPRGPYEGPGVLPPPPGGGSETVTVLAEDDLSQLSVARVLAALGLG
jgi:ADP-heptose:LPS heptosyltransferase